MIEKTVLDYLNNALSVDCFMEMPEGTPDSSFIVIEKTGSDTTNFINKSTIAVQSYARTLYEAALLNDDVKATMEALTQLPSVSRCDLNSDYNFTDTAMRIYRYQAVFDITHY
ncbi:MAG: hypothetical protein IKZ66_03570 [Schwartzia sp.]|nr:hypothetical protein [Schwartzia sp. (in: firmicutes)]